MGKQSKQMSKQQVADLVTYLTEDFGSELTREKFEECLLVMLEDVAGLESLKPTQQKALVEDAYSLYIKQPDQE